MKMTEMERNKKTSGFGILDFGLKNRKPNQKQVISNSESERGMSLLAVMAVMTLFAIGLLAVAPTVQQEVQREKELESIRRGEEVAKAIEEYVNYHQGRKFPTSMDDLLEGLPQGTKKRQILRASAAIDPLSEDGRWQLVPLDKMKNFARRVQNYNNGLLPTSENLHPSINNQLGVIITNIDTKSEEDATASADETDAETFTTDNNPFIGVVSQSKSRSVIAYYGIENHSKWVFTPLFRGSGETRIFGSRGPGGNNFNGGGRNNRGNSNTMQP
jgi:type II secretory pathway pseudopilin PulG